MRRDSDGRVCRLLDVLLVELSDERGLDSGAAGGQLGGVDGNGGGSRGVDWSGGGEDLGETGGNLRGVRGTAGEDNLELSY